MAWLSRVNFISSDTLSFSDINNLGNDIRAWGASVNGGGYTLSNVVISASSGTMGLVIGGTGTTSALLLRSTSGVGTTGADIVFQVGNNGATEAARIANNGNVGIGTIPFNTLHVNGVVQIDQVAGAASLYMGSGTTGNSGKVTYDNNNSRFLFSIGGSEKIRIDSVGNVKVGGTADRATTAGTNQVVIFNGTAPAGTLTNGASLYVTAGEMRVMDAAGNATLISPHDSGTNEWIYDSVHTPTGKRLRIDVERLLRRLNDELVMDCVHEVEE